MIERIREFGVAVPGADYVLRPGGYLVVRNSRREIAIVSTPQGFFLPGGGQDNDESPAQAAVREAYEECGLRVQLGGLLGTADELLFAAPEGKYYRKRCVFFGAELIGREEGGEADHQLAWMTAEEAAARLKHQSQSWAVMEAKEDQVKKKVFIDCPVCCSGNRFHLEKSCEELTCDDCGFVLAEAHELKSVDAGRCVFCGSEYFYVESPLSLSLLGEDSVCYVCEAKYKGARLNSSARKYSDATRAEAQGSEASKAWRERVGRHA